MNYFSLHIGDYAAATAHLTWDEDMSYTRLIRAYYHSERGIDDSQKYRQARAVTSAQRKSVDSVLSEFFYMVDGIWVQKRCEEEIEKYHQKQSKAAASANVRWGKHSQSERNANEVKAHTEAHANALPTQCEGNANQEPITNNQHTAPRKRGISIPIIELEMFAIFYNAYPRKVGKPKALEAWAKINPDAAIVDEIRLGLHRWKASRDWEKNNGEFIPHPATWINQKRWEDHPLQVVQGYHSGSEKPHELAI